MTDREFFVKQFGAEWPKFLKVLRALPEGKLDYKPHERNSSAGDIAWFLVLELRALVAMVNTLENHWEQPAGPGSAAAIAAEYEKAAQEMERTLAAAGEDKWAQDTKMYVGGRLLRTAPLGESVWDFFFDAIHHRGQLTAYLRPMGGKVPAIYGPSGDES